MLLAADEPFPVLENNVSGPSPFLFTCDHYGRLVPRALGDLGVPPAEWERHIAWDIGIAGVTALLSKALDAHMIAQRYSRLVIDCNRPPGVSSSIPVLSEATPIPGNENISDESAAARRKEIFQPYHDRIADILDERARDNRTTVFVAMHSFTPVYAGVERPWHIGMLYNRDARLAKILMALLHAEGDLVVGDNQPYAASDATDYAIPVHAEPRGLVHTGIEIRQDLIGDEAGQRAWAERLTRIFHQAERQLGVITG
ncbi:N-formylglutamate amidohydrolase [Bradyrhizobium sp. LHD-71]|uniref:N-formylglutamate amidohydrolase n=1 Tax=Bradyrhizobium sp. LHD-71 TaxID=3072141 RepID=UPI0028100382|nr:N-formylglutamate amidohydrolase [Bradyrhizobium sp. LHD-71]MDQ8726966.1 N-formylglutamate amidohydrolase [Bradyrhizobium sp. LHD-71]